jgi:hypothetical protein
MASDVLQVNTCVPALVEHGLALAMGMVRIFRAGIALSALQFQVGPHRRSAQWFVQQTPESGVWLSSGQPLRLSVNARLLPKTVLALSSVADQQQAIRVFVLAHTACSFLEGAAFEPNFARWWLRYRGYPRLASLLTDEELRRLWPATALLDRIATRPAQVSLLLANMLRQPLTVDRNAPLALASDDEQRLRLGGGSYRLGADIALGADGEVLGRRVVLRLPAMAADEVERLIVEHWLEPQRIGRPRRTGPGLLVQPGPKLRALAECLFSVRRRLECELTGRPGPGWVLGQSEANVFGEIALSAGRTS